ncbi:MAG: RagB/SusD family nutrient uptake outer membrane protein [Bacteroidaceae bacterium]|nr:RagB/SusD family nutrient uptake outer membrane protein [Bacteroidaceae bacterium]
MKKVLYITHLVVALLAMTSCEDFLNIIPEGQAKRDELLLTTEGLEEAMYGVYSQLRSTTLYGQELHFHTLEIMAHNMHCSGHTTITALGNFEYDNTNVKSLFEGIWTTMYKNISNVNSVLNSPLIVDAEEFPYTIYKGEALGLRAFMHFDLVRLFAEQYTQNPSAAGLPYATEFSLNTPDFESLQDNYKHILADLHEAERLLDNEEEHEGEGSFMLDRQIHFNKHAVKATLARVYLTMGDKENAAKYAKEVIDAKKYYLKEMTEVRNDVAGVLSKKECIFGVYYAGFFTQVYEKLHKTTTFYSLNLRQDFDEIYNRDHIGNDYRWSSYFITNHDQVYRLSKLTDIYELDNNAASRPTDLILGINMIRIPEMYYIMAETLLEDDPDAALGFYNEVRTHRGLEPLPTTVTDEITGELVERPLTLQHINEERYKEYFGEGQLFFNMKRLNQDISIFDNTITHKGGIHAETGKKIYVVPIPDIEIENRY